MKSYGNKRRTGKRRDEPSTTTSQFANTSFNWSGQPSIDLDLNYGWLIICSVVTYGIDLQFCMIYHIVYFSWWFVLLFHYFSLFLRINIDVHDNYPRRLCFYWQIICYFLLHRVGLLINVLVCSEYGFIYIILSLTTMAWHFLAYCCAFLSFTVGSLYFCWKCTSSPGGRRHFLIIY